MKKIILLLLITFLASSCATLDSNIIDVQQKVIARKYTQNKDFYFQLYDGTVLLVDSKTYHDFREQQTVQLTWRRK